MTATDQTSTFFDRGACAGLDPELFHPGRGESTGPAKTVCRSCGVRVDCLEWALANREVHGIWGGTSERERRRVRRRIAAGQAVPELDPEWTPTDLVLAPPLPPPRPPTSSTPSRKEPPVDLDLAPPTPPAPANGSRPVDPRTGLPTDVCVNCGRRYTPGRSTQRFCRKECARAWYAAHPRSGSAPAPPAVEKPGTDTRAAKACEDCGQPFSPKRAEQRFCSSACAGRWQARKGSRRGGRPRSKPAPAAVHQARPAFASAQGVDVQVLLGQLLAACDRWAVEADIGDIRISVTRGCRP